MRISVILAVVATGAALVAAPPSPAVPAPLRPQPKQTSDGLPGEIAPPMPRWARGLPPVITDDVTWDVAAGLTYRQWSQTDARGTISAHLLSADLDEPTLSLRYVGPDRIRQRAPLSRLLARTGAIAGVNGDFFDIADIGAPLGVGVDRRRLLHGPVLRPNAALVVDDAGEPHVSTAHLSVRIAGRPGIRITNLNSPTVDAGGVAVYTPRWGRTAGYRVVGRSHRHLREVVVRRGKVVSNRTTLSKDRLITGRVLVGRGAGADQLRRLKVGRRVRIVTAVEGSPRLVLTSNRVLLKDSQLRVGDDRILHPRSAVGVDVDGRRLLVLVVDGRQESSSGYTMVQLATLMRDLGAEEALNLDGGGSSTMVARGVDGLVAVRNSPSDGQERRIPNGLGFVSTAPPPPPPPDQP